MSYIDFGGAEKVGNNFFDGCKRLTEVVFSPYMSEISEGMFYNCDSLKIIDFPNQIQYIGKWAFFNCDSLESASCKNIKRIGEEAFMG